MSLAFPGHRVSVAALALGGALTVLTGCGGSSKAAAPPPTVTQTVTADASTPAPATTTAAPASTTTAAQPDACSLLTPAEAEVVATTKLMAPVAAGGAAGMATLCQFTGPVTGPTAQVEVYVGDGAKKQLDIERVTLKHAFTTVAGIGDQCFQENDWIFVEKDNVWASIRLVRFNADAANVKPLQKAASLVASRLP